MRETIAANGLTLCHKHSDGWVKSTLPDVCKSPTVPKPYTNVAYARDLAKGTTTVFSHGGAMNGVKGSEFYRSFGDEPGVGGGVVSGVNLHRATFLSWSPNVFMEGRHVTRLTDRMLLNKGNTISAGGYYTGQLRDDKNKPLAEQICKAACECQAAGTMNGRCVAEKVEAWSKRLGRNIVPEVAWEVVDDVWKMRQAPDGRILRGGGKRPGDFTDFDLGGFVEYKGPGDRLRRGQSRNLDDISADNGLSREDINFKKDCDCSGGGDKDGTATAPVTEPAPAAERSTWESMKQFASDHPYLTGAGLVVGGVLTGGALYYGGAAVAAGLAASAGTGALAVSAAN